MSGTLMPRGTAMDTIDTDLPCMRCGYNLRTLSESGACPECGEYVGATIAATALRVAPYGRLRALSPQTLASAKRAVTLATVAWFAGLPMVIPTLALPYSVSYAVHGICELLPFVGCYVLSAWAAWHLTIAGQRGGVIVPRITRSLIVAGVAAVGLVFLNARWADYYTGRFPSVRFERTLEGLRSVGRVFAVAWPLVTIVTCVRLASLASMAARSGAAITFKLLAY